MLQQKVELEYEKRRFLRKLRTAKRFSFEERLPCTAVRDSLQLTVGE
jgi:hypothetical protein